MNKENIQERCAQIDVLTALADKQFSYEEMVAMLSKAVTLMNTYEIERMLSAVEMDLTDLSF